MVVCNQSLMACGICIPPIFTSGKEDENNAIVKSNHRRVDRLARWSSFNADRLSP